MSGTIDWDDMRLFAKVAEHGSVTRAAAAAGVPKQTVSRRLARLEAALGVRLLHRTTRSLKLTSAGATYAARCVELSRMAVEANRAAMDANDVPQGTLTVTADPVFGEAFLGPLIVAYCRRWPATRVTVSLTRRNVDLVEEGFDVAFRIGNVDHPTLSGLRLGPARVRYCASPTYVAARGPLGEEASLAGHDWLFVGSDDGQPRWPMPRGQGGFDLVTLAPRMRVSSLAIAREVALAGLGVALFPEFACADDLRAGRLVDMLGGRAVDVGSVWILHPTRGFLPKRVTAFIDLARSHFASPPWLVSSKPGEDAVAFAPTMGRNAEVDAWFERYENPMKPVVERVRALVLGADPRIAECVKWQAPTFTYRGNLASFFPKSKQHASLMFHLGARIPGAHPRLEGTGDTSRVMKIGSVAEATAAKKDIERVVRAWCDWRDAEAPVPKMKPAPKKPAPKAKPKKKPAR